MRKILIIRKQFSHHTKYSGYDILSEKIMESSNSDSIFIDDYKKYLRGFGWFYNVILFFIRKKNLYYTNYYFLCELSILAKNLIHKYDIIYFTYAEPHLFVCNKFKFLLGKTKLVASVHLPKSLWHRKEYDLINNIKNCDKLFFLDWNSLRSFNFISEDKKSFLPHPVNSNYFRLDLSKKNNSDKLNILFCGNFLRDLDLLYNTIINSKDTSMFHIVVSSASINNPLYKLLENKNNCIIYYSISDEELLELYQYCDILFLPLKESTANNVVLEAMSCGLPISFTSEGIRSYVTNDFSYDLNAINVASIAELLNNLVSQKELLKKQGEHARRHIEKNLSIDIIAYRLMSEFELILK